MKHSGLSSIALALVLSAGVANAADLPSMKAPLAPPPPPPPMWNGFYVGLNAGGTWSNNNSISVGSLPGPCTSAGAGCTLDPNFSATSALLGTFTMPVGSNSGFMGGGQIGYNYQFHPSFLVGFETDIQGIAGSTGARSFASAAENPNFAGFGFPIVNMASASRSLDYLGTVRGRLGWLVMPSLLVYGTGGLAYGGVTANLVVGQQVQNQQNFPFTGGNPYFAGAAFSDTRVGWTVGGGLEWMFLPNWSAKVEYLYYDLGSVRMFAATPLINLQTDDGLSLSSAFTSATTRFNGNVVRAGVNYHFNWAQAPILAKY